MENSATDFTEGIVRNSKRTVEDGTMCQCHIAQMSKELVRDWQGEVCGETFSRCQCHLAQSGGDFSGVCQVGYVR